MADQQQQPQQPPQPPYPPHYYRRKKSNWWIPVVIIGAIILIFFGFIFVIFNAVSSSFEKEEITVKSNSVLHLNFEGGVEEYTKTQPFEFFGGSKQVSFFEMINAIEAAKEDDNIKGIYYKSVSGGMGFAQAMEFQKVLKDFKESGKFVYAYFDMGSEYSYFNALPADKIFMPRDGIMEVNGFSITNLFMKDLFAKLGIDFHIQAWEDYKSAAESFGRNSYSDSARYQLRQILDQRYENFTSALREYRGLKKEKVDSALDAGLFTANSLKDNGFIDDFMSESDVKDMMKEKAWEGDKETKDEDKKLRMIHIRNYYKSDLPKTGEVASKDKHIAIIFGAGSIVSRTDDSPFSDDMVITPKDFNKYLKKAREDEKVKAIIIRMDSPGGSAIASAEIYNEIMKTKEVKPVYASMGDVAASGGYYIPVACDTIIAHPSTITGSIGVISLIPNMSRMLDKIYLHVDTLGTNKNSHFMNPMLPFSEQDKEKFKEITKGIYFRFIEKVAKNRDKSFEETRAIAKGRVWTGEAAKEIGLVDVLGNFEDALKIAKRRIGVPDTSKVYVHIYPKPVDEITALLKVFGLDNSNSVFNSGKQAQLEKVAKVLGADPGLLQETLKAMPAETRKQFKYMLQLLSMSEHEKTLMAMPYLIDTQ